MRKSVAGYLFRLALVASLSLVLAACGSKVNQANFDKIKNGMTQDEVISILGSPTDTSTVKIAGLSGSSAKWTDKQGTITIQFANGKVRFKQFTRSGG